MSWKRVFELWKELTGEDLLADTKLGSETRVVKK